jgi:hypothetical protein
MAAAADAMRFAAEAERLSARVGYDSGSLGSYIPVRVTVTAELPWRYRGLSGLLG